MSSRDDDFDLTVRRALGDVTAAARPDPTLADRLIANVHGDGAQVVNLDGRRRPVRWIAPLLAAAAVAVLAVGAAIGAHVLADSDNGPATSPSPLPSIGPSPVVSTVHSTPTASLTESPTSAPPPTPVVPHFTAVDVYFADARHGWAVGDALCESGSRTDCTTLVATDDGGTSWRKLNVPPNLVSSLDRSSGSCNTNGGIVGPCVDHVRFANESDGYLWGLHEFYWTTDGGQSWTRETDPASGERGNLEMVIAGDRAVRLAPIAQCSAGCAGAIETAPVGTADWQVTTPAGPLQIGYYSSALGMHGTDVYLFAGATVSTPSTGIWRSTDGGRSWDLFSQAPCGPGSGDDFFAGSAIVADDGALIIRCGAALRVAESGSAEFGAARQLPHESDTVTAADSGTSITLTRFELNDEFRVTCYRSTDGGQTWLTGATVLARGVRFASGSLGFAAGVDIDAFYRTNDGGLTWSRGSFAG